MLCALFFRLKTVSEDLAENGPIDLAVCEGLRNNRLKLIESIPRDPERGT
jgi:hypothetical protein